MAPPLIEIASDRFSAAINPLGAELSHLRDREGRELMTDADPAFWTGRAPLLFPIVGALNGDTYRLDGREYAMQKHGFARRSTFELVEHQPDRAHFRLTDTDETRAIYPFAFALDVMFTVRGAALAIEASVSNRGDANMPASFGFHPAFAWPLPYGVPREAHRIEFAEAETGSLRALDGEGLIVPEARQSPVEGRTLALRDRLFAADALIWQPVQSRSLRYGPPEGPALDIAFDAPMLGIWTKPGAHYVCVEPWWGIADPAGFAGEIWDKPGIMRIAPGETRSFGMQVTLAR